MPLKIISKQNNTQLFFCQSIFQKLIKICTRRDIIIIYFSFWRFTRFVKFVKTYVNDDNDDVNDANRCSRYGLKCLFAQNATIPEHV